LVGGGFQNVDGPYPIACPDDGFPNQNNATKCKPDQNVADQTKSGYLFSLSSYFLNGFAFAGSSGIGWGVGDRGAIERLAGNDAAAGGTVQPENRPTLGGRRNPSAPAHQPYESTAPPVTGNPGTVPALSSQPSQLLSTPRLQSYGAPNPQSERFGGESVKQLVMSRDGSDGWAIGPFNTNTFGYGQATTLYRFEGTRWRRCNIDSVEGVIAADPACEALRPLSHYKNGAQLSAIARIPMEYGSDPTKSDEFEAIMAATVADRHAIYRYQDGRWTVDQDASKLITDPVTDIAFAGPDDGWIRSDGGNAHEIYHFDGKGWKHCSELLGFSGAGVVDPAGCDDYNHVIPAADYSIGAGMHLTSAGDRLYFYGHRLGPDKTTNRPVILYKDPGPCEKAGDAGCWQQAYDPGCIRQDQDPQDPTKRNCVADSDQSKVGTLTSLSVAVGPDGSYNGWAAGQFSAPATAGRLEKGAKETPFLHSNAAGTNWQPAHVDDVAADYLLPMPLTQTGASNVPGDPPQTEVVAVPGPGGNGRVFAEFSRAEGSSAGANRPTVWLDPVEGQWHVLQTPFVQMHHGDNPIEQAAVQALAADNSGGLWLVAGPGPFDVSDSAFYRFTDQARPELFKEVAHPFREFVNAAAGGGDGSFWVATNSNVLYRYDRQTGWDRMTVPGWDPGRIVTNPSPANAIAIGPDGKGLVVGKQGRIADVGPEGAVLDQAAGILCSRQTPANQPPCGTGRDLRTVSVAPDGSAMAGGDARALLYRDGAAGQFHAVPPPPTAVYSSFTGVSMPQANEAWVVTDTGEIYAGALSGGSWSWTREDTDPFGDSISRDVNRKQRPLLSIAMDGSGHGFAVGEQGTIVERTGQGTPPWRRVDAGQLDDLRSVVLGPHGKGALIGGDDGLILTLVNGRFEQAHVPDRYEPVNLGFVKYVSRVAGLGLLAGARDGSVEAWAATQVPVAQNNRIPEPTAILHYSSDPADPLLDGGHGRAQALADTPVSPAEDLSFAAFGNSSCQNGIPHGDPCLELLGSNEAHDRTALEVRDEILARRGRAGAPAFSLFTGDVGDTAGSGTRHPLGTPLENSVIHDRWTELIATPLDQAGVPIYGAIGARDTSLAFTCQPPTFPQYCARTHESGLGASLAWRQSMAGMPAPWGANGAAAASSSRGLTFEAVDTGGTKRELDDIQIADPTKALGGTTVEDPTKAVGDRTLPDPTPGHSLGDRQVTSRNGVAGDKTLPGDGLVGDQTVRTGGAHTHYALDVKRDGKAVMRLVVLDTSLKSLAASNANQNPVEEQLGWLKDALQRPADERAVVLTSTPTYSYGPGANTDTLTEGTVLESILLQNKVDLVVDGRLGWNALYWAFAPGVHWPCPGDTYKSAPPQGLPSCNGLGSSQADNAAADAQKSAAELSGGGVSASGTLPFLVAHSAGGKFGPDGQAQGSAANGFWRGYSIVHLDTQTGQVRVEQRPVYDWIGIGPAPGQGNKGHVLRPKQSITLAGYGREVLGIDTSPRYDEISTPAITHCYDLVLADQDKPWLPLMAKDASKEQLAGAAGAGCRARLLDSAGNDSGQKNPCDPYVCLDPAIGRLTDDQQGKIEAGDGNVKRTFAIAILSVNQKVASYPIAFEPRPSFTPEAPPPPPPPNGPPPPPPPPPAPNGQLPQINLPTPPVPPSVPLDAGLVPPPPPAVPPPPGASSATPLNLFLNGPGLNIAPQSTVVPPPAPPIQPAPPGGARKEARQKQAATQDSGAGADESVSQEKSDGGDMANAPMAPQGAPMTRHQPESNAATRRDRVAPSQSFTPLVRHGQPSAWVQDLEWGGGMTLMALVLAFGWITVRPTPRRREPELPAPAHARIRRGR
ncbi:MAG: hypothetical protein QOG09_332, partial [Solirubrobacterales bacterium]|nr:hypothetical protein [Solirubrobacterales bacterium]